MSLTFEIWNVSLCICSVWLILNVTFVWRSSLSAKVYSFHCLNDWLWKQDSVQHLPVTVILLLRARGMGYSLHTVAGGVINTCLSCFLQDGDGEESVRPEVVCFIGFLRHYGQLGRIFDGSHLLSVCWKLVYDYGGRTHYASKMPVIVLFRCV